MGLSFSRLVPISLLFACVLLIRGITAVFFLLDPAFAAASSLPLVSQLCPGMHRKELPASPLPELSLVLGGWDGKKKRLGKTETMSVQNLAFGFSVHIPLDLSLVSDGSTGLGVPDPVLQFSSVSQQLGPSCKCPNGHREGMFPQPQGKGHRRQRGRQASSALLPPLADEGNAHQHRDKNRLANGGNWEENGSRG